MYGIEASFEPSIAHHRIRCVSYPRRATAPGADAMHSRTSVESGSNTQTIACGEKCGEKSGPTQHSTSVGRNLQYLIHARSKALPGHPASWWVRHDWCPGRRPVRTHQRQDPDAEAASSGATTEAHAGAEWQQLRPIGRPPTAIVLVGQENLMLF